MNNVDAVFLAAEALVYTHTVVDTIINAALYYGPGILLTAAVTAAWKTGRRILNGFYQRIDDRATRRYYTVVAARLNRVADNTDQIIADAGERLADQLRNQLYATGTEGEK